jgi:hypothetical protein
VAAEAGEVIGSLRGVAIAAVVAVALVIAVLVDGGRRGAAVDRAVVPGFDPDRVTGLAWQRPGQPAIRVVRAAGAWRLDAASAFAVDPGAIADVLAALRGARWHRRGAPTATHASLTITGSGPPRVLGLGAPIAGASQAWIVAGDRGLVVDGWLVRALDRDRLGLQVTRPLAEVERAGSVVIERAEPRAALRLEGTPRRLVRPVALAVIAELTGELERALRGLTIVRLPVGVALGRGLAIRLTGTAAVVTVELGGPCPGAPELVALSGSAGDGCVEPAAVAAIARAVEALAQPAARIVDPRPIGWEPRGVVLPDGTALDLATSRVGDAAADPARVAELLAALAAPAEVVARPARPADRQLAVTDRAGVVVTLELFADRVVARHGEPVALRPGPSAWALLVRPANQLRDPVLWREEPATISAIRIDGVRYRRGAAIGDWAREPAGAVDGAAIEAVVALVAAPRALGFGGPGFPPAHRVTLAITPPAGPPGERVLELGASLAAGCPARVGRDAVVLPAALCARVAALAR